MLASNCLYLSAAVRFSENLWNRRFGSRCAIPISGSDLPGEANMAFLILKVLGSWSLIATVAGLGLGAAIARGERVRKDEFLSYVFACVETMQGSRG